MDYLRTVELPHTANAAVSRADIERAILGSILLERDALGLVADRLSPERFLEPGHAQIYDAMRACYLRREPPDLATVASQMRRQGTLDGVGGLAYLGALAAGVPSSVYIERLVALLDA